MVPIVIVPVVFTIYPKPAFVEPCCTNVKSPYATSPDGELSASVARVRTHGFEISPVAVTA